MKLQKLPDDVFMIIISEGDCQNLSNLMKVNKRFRI